LPIFRNCISRTPEQGLTCSRYVTMKYRMPCAVLALLPEGATALESNPSRYLFSSLNRPVQPRRAILTPGLALHYAASAEDACSHASAVASIPQSLRVAVPVERRFSSRALSQQCCELALGRPRLGAMYLQEAPALAGRLCLAEKGGRPEPESRGASASIRRGVSFLIQQRGNSDILVQPLLFRVRLAACLRGGRPPVEYVCRGPPGAGRAIRTTGPKCHCCISTALGATASAGAAICT